MWSRVGSFTSSDLALALALALGLGAGGGGLGAGGGSFEPEDPPSVGGVCEAGFVSSLGASSRANGIGNSLCFSRYSRSRFLLLPHPHDYPISLSISLSNPQRPDDETAFSGEHRNLV